MTDFFQETLLQLGDFRLTFASLIFVFAVIVLTKLILWAFQRVLFHRVRQQQMDAGRKHSLLMIARYFLWTIAIVVMLQAIGIQITLLIAGSAALLVGIGFGLQQIFADIISGIFMLFEGSVKIDDVMEVNGIVGRVQAIHLRTSVLETRDGINMIIPNHKFVNENIVNWSHNANPSRFRVSVGVAYGSDERNVRNILLECAEGHADIIQGSPEYPPMVRLFEFGDNALGFELLFWSLNQFRIETTKSDLRFSILQKFRENNIVIAFPQRDIHFMGPLTVQGTLPEPNHPTK